MTGNDTIFALATPPGRGGISVIRLSGEAAAEAARRLTLAETLPAPRLAARRRFVNPEDGSPLDDGLMIWFPRPHSFTGEDVVELHLHGGRATVEAVSSALAQGCGLRVAEPGEFSKRAFLNGKIDLTEAEALADLIDADTDAQRRLALRQLGGELSDQLETWRRELIDVLAHMEAWIDFPDEDLPSDVASGAKDGISRLRSDISAFLSDNRRGERLRDGFHAAILGAPNAGKSSLLNALTRREVAIVSDTEGTTRDVLEAHLDLGGWPVTLADTAGLRDAPSDVEREGVRRALGRAEDADLKIIVFDACNPPDLSSRDLIEEGSLIVVNKSDLCPEIPETLSGFEPVSVSAKTGSGLTTLLECIEQRAAQALGDRSGPVLTRTRHRQALEACVEALDRALEEVEPELAAEELRLAAGAIGRITGRVDVEDLLDVVFSDFCIGK